MDEVKDFVFLNSEIIEESVPFRSLFYGEGVFETLRWKEKLGFLKSIKEFPLPSDHPPPESNSSTGGKECPM